MTIAKTKETASKTNPSHYKLQITPIEYIMENKLDFCEGNVVKYISRHRQKDGAEDVKKAIQYCKFILEMEYGIRDSK